MNANFIGRENEQRELLNSYETVNSEFVAVYGRRRVGKTYLIKTTFDDKIDFLFTGVYKSDQKTQLEFFKMELLRVFPQAYKGKIDSWKKAFFVLSDYLRSLKKERVVVFFDELPWMDTPKGDLLVSLSYFWNMWDSKDGLLKLYVCGSSTTWMLNKLIGDKGGLYGRVGKKIYLAPFSLYETKLYLNEIKNAHYNDIQVLNTYMILGGIPFYLNMIDTSLPLSKNIDNLFFKTNGALRNEFDFVFRSLFKESANYQKIVLALSTKLTGLNREEISELTKISGGTLTTMLKNLRACDFLRCYSTIDNKSKNKIYQLIDPFTLFYLHFVKDEEGQNEDFWTINQSKPIINSWLGYAYEIVCFNHINQIKKGLYIAGINSSIHSWKTNKYIDENNNQWSGAQIDMVIDRDDNVINVVEIKYTDKDKYNLTKSYYDKVYERIENFKTSTKTKKAIVCTFITTQGLKENTYSRDIISQLTLGDLMKE